MEEKFNRTEHIHIRVSKWEKDILEKAIKLTGQDKTRFITSAFIEKANWILKNDKQ